MTGGAALWMALSDVEVTAGDAVAVAWQTLTLEVCALVGAAFGMLEVSVLVDALPA